MRPGVVRLESDTDLPRTNSRSGNRAPQPANQDMKSLSRAHREGEDGGREREGERGQGKDGPARLVRGASLLEEHGKSLLFAS